MRSTAHLKLGARLVFRKLCRKLTHMLQRVKPHVCVGTAFGDERAQNFTMYVLAC